MKTMRLEKMTVQGGKGAPLMMLPLCVCGAGSSEPSSPAQPSWVPTCSQCGGSLPQPSAPVGQEDRHLQDFLSAFV